MGLPTVLTPAHSRLATAVTAAGLFALLLAGAGAVVFTSLFSAAAAQDTTTRPPTSVDLALVLVKSPGQTHQANIEVHPPKASFTLIVKNQGDTPATAINVVTHVPAGMAYSPLSAPPLPTTSLSGAAASLTKPTAGQFVIDELLAGDTIGIDIVLEIVDQAPGRFVLVAEIASALGPDGEPALDVDSTPDANPSNDEIEASRGIDSDDPANSHNDISYDETPGGDRFPTPNDEDDHDAEVVVVPPVVAMSMRFDAEASLPLAAGKPVTFLVDVSSLGGPANEIDVIHLLDADVWAPFSLADNAVSSFGGRDLVWKVGEGPVSVTMTGSLTLGESDTIAVRLTPAPGFVGDPVDLAHLVRLGEVNDADPHTPRRSVATAEALDLALRLTVDAAASDLPPQPGSTVKFIAEIMNQGSVPARSIQVYDHVDPGLWNAFVVSANPPGVTSGDAALAYSWSTDPFGATAVLGGTLLPGQTATLPIWLEVGEGFVDPLGYLSNEAEISAAVATLSDGVTEATTNGGRPLTDVDSEPDIFNYDPTVDDVVDNEGGDEDDHDTAYIDQRFAVGNQVWADANANGVFDAGEAPLAGVELELLLIDDDGSFVGPVATQTSDADGMYLFDGLSPGSYAVRVSASSLAAGSIAFAGEPSAAPTALTAGIDNRNDLVLAADGTLLAGPVDLGDGSPTNETPRVLSSTADIADDLTLDIGLVFPTSADGSQGTGDTSQPQRLAFTGATHTALLLVALVLLSVGVVLEVAHRRLKSKTQTRVS